MSEKAKIENRGGRRVGAGRPPFGKSKKKVLNVWLSVEVIEQLKAEKSRSEFINQLLKKHYGIVEKK